MDDFFDSKENRKIVLGYNKSVMLGEITERSMKIITEDIDPIQDSLNEFSTFIGQMSDYVKRFSQVLGNFSTEISEVRQSFSETKTEEGKLAEAITEISVALEQESITFMYGTPTMESTINLLKESQVVVHALVSTCKRLSRLMDRDQ